MKKFLLLSFVALTVTPNVLLSMTDNKRVLPENVVSDLTSNTSLGQAIEQLCQAKNECEQLLAAFDILAIASKKYAASGTYEDKRTAIDYLLSITKVIAPQLFEKDDNKAFIDLYYYVGANAVQQRDFIETGILDRVKRDFSDKKVQFMRSVLKNLAPELYASVSAIPVFIIAI